MAIDDRADGRDRDRNVEVSYLKAFDVDGSVDRFLALSLRGMRLVTASAAFTRLRSVLQWTCKANWDENDEEQWDRGIDAAEDYGILREALLRSLEEEPAFRFAFELVRQAFALP